VDTTNDVGQDTSIAFSPSGVPYVSYYDLINGNLRVAQVSRQAEITLSPSVSVANGAALSESHSDMTTVSDSSNRDDADCIGGGTWNNGIHSVAENLAITLPAGDTTTQCTEVQWTIDTSQAVEGTTYRFVIATDDGFNQSSGKWRGPISITSYPTLTIESDTDIRYSKDNMPDAADCTGSSSWGCENIDNNIVFEYASIAFSPNGTPYVSYYDSTNFDLRLAQYVGSGGTGCDSDSDVWTCTAVDSTGTVGQFTSIAFSPNGTPYVSYYDSTNTGLRVAQYVGTGGTGCAVSSWTCTAIDTTNDVGSYTSIAFSPNGTPYISYYDFTNFDLRVAQYVGSGGTGCAVSTWTCTAVDSTGTVGQFTSIAFSPNGTPYVSYYDTTDSTSRVAQYVGSGGTGCAVSTWTCTAVDVTNNVGSYTSIAFSTSGQVFVSHYDSADLGLLVARLRLPNESLSSDQGGIKIPSGDLRFRLSDGRSPRTNYNGTCGISAASYMGYCGLLDSQGDYDSIITAANETPIYAGAVQFTTNTQLPRLFWKGRTSLAPSTAGVSGDLYLQIYRYGTTNSWETISSDTASSDCNTADCLLTGAASGTVSEYFQSSGSEYWVNVRVYQRSGSAITFKTDVLSATITGQRLRGGRVFEGEVTKPLNTD
jgi:hypothetical protein